MGKNSILILSAESEIQKREKNMLKLMWEKSKSIDKMLNLDRTLKNEYKKKLKIKSEYSKMLIVSIFCYAKITRCSLE